MTTLYEANGVSLYEYEPSFGDSWVGVTEFYPAVQRYRVTFFGSESGDVSVSVDAQIFDDRPGELANYTPETGVRCDPSDTLMISDDGVFTALQRVNGPSFVDLRHGIVMKLPVEYVGPIRQAIAIARHRAFERREAAEAKTVCDGHATADALTELAQDREMTFIGASHITVRESNYAVCGEDRILLLGTPEGEP